MSAAENMRSVDDQRTLKPLSGSEMGEVVMPLLGENSSDSHLFESRGNALLAACRREAHILCL